jgi:hypothetical protein
LNPAEHPTGRRPRRGSLPLFLIFLFPAFAVADTPLASSNFAGAEDPLFENGAWAPLTSLSAGGGRFQKNNGAFPDRFSPEHAGARTTAPMPTDHYSEIVVKHVGNPPVNNNVGPIVRVQTSGPTIDSHYLWWAGPPNGVNNLYRIDATGTSFTASPILPTSAAADGDRLRLIARGLVVYGIKNGVREFIYNTGRDPTKISGGTAGMLAYVSGPALTDASIASWSGGAAAASSGVWDSSAFAGVENPLDEGDRWYPLPGYTGFRKAGGLAIGLSGGHNLSGVWSIAPPARQYSEVTLGTAASGGGGPIVRIDRNNPGQTGWLLFLWADNPPNSGIYKVNPDGSFTFLRAFTPTIVPGDKWRLTADGNTLDVSRNGISQLTFTTDGSYPAGDVGMEALGQSFTFSAWEGGDPAGPVPPGPPTITSFTPTSGAVGASVTIDGTNFTGATSVTFNGVTATFTVGSATSIRATVPAGATTGPLSVTTPRGTATSASSFTVVSPPSITSFSPTSGAVGTTVAISGTNFTGATAVAFNGVSATFTVSSATSIQATVPARATSGPLSVTTPQGTATSSSSFTVVNPPTITSFSPTSGAVGTTVAISGTNFTGATAVAFNGVSATFTVSSATSIQATVPAGATTGPLRVTTPQGTATSASSFTVLNPPTITSFSPTTGPVGTTVTISGTKFTGASAVAFNGVGATFRVTSDTSIQATVPAGATTGPLSVTTPGGTGTSGSSFTVLSPPAIASFSPTSGPVGTSVTISGTNFTGATAVAFNGVGASFTVISDTAIQAIVPAGARTGPLSVATPGGTATSAGNFAVTAILTVAKAGTGTGSVTSTSSPASATQIDCGATCSVSYDAGTVVTLTATAAAGSVQTGWTGCDTVSGPTCTVTMNAARRVTATFALQTFTLTVTKSRLLTGNGTVTSSSSPASSSQINCGSTCSASYVSGTVVTLRVSLSFLSIFNGWSGCDTVSGTTCTVTMNRARSVNASFLP